jgi:ornithine carbamoyltransferase
LEPNVPRNFIALADHSAEDLRRYLDLARMIKLNPLSFRDACAGKTLAMIFQKPSLRTRVSFQTGIFQLGGQAINLGPRDIQLHRGESVSDTAQVLARYVDGIMARLFSHQDLLDLASQSIVPVINGLTDYNHPVQVLADLQTIEEKCGRLGGLKLAYVGDGNNMAHSLLSGGAIMGMHVAVAHPRGYAPNPEAVTQARSLAALSGGSILITEDPVEAVADAHVVYTDTWTSMGQEEEAAERRARFEAFQVNEGLMAGARPQAIFMHCLPAHRGEEVSASVIDGPRSVIFDQAENRLHAQKAIMVHLMGRGRS